MSQKKPKPKSDQAPNLFEILTQEGNPQYMRFYLQEDYFVCFPLAINQEEGTLKQDTKTPLLLKLFMNKVIFNCVSDVLINNKFVYNNSKIMNTTMQSGRDMVLGKYLKKHINWLGFLNRKQFIMIKKAYDGLSLQDQLRIQYSVLSISNLILKLGINISKLSCILSQRKYTTAFLSIPTLSVVFLQYLMYKFFEGKEIDKNDQQAKSQFIRQLPRITYIKLSQVINKAELMTLEIGEQVFFTSQTLRRVKNIQYLQFYQHQERDGIKGYENITNYEYIKAVNLRQSLGIQSPFGFELLFLFRTIYFQVIKDFNPDVILFVEDYDSKHKIIQPDIRALLLSELMENVTGKIFVLRQIGYRANFEYITSTNSLALQDYQKNKQKKPTEGQVLEVYGSEMQEEQSSQPYFNHEQIMKKIQTENDHSPKKEVKTFLTSKQVEEMIMKRIQTLNMMTPEIQKKLDQEEMMMIKKAEIEYNLNIIKGVVSGDIQQMEEILRDDLSYISLALIQQSSFEEICTKSHRYIYSEQFLKKVVTSTYQCILQLKESFQKKNQLINKLELSKQMVTSMIENLKLPTFTMYQDYYNTVYDIKSGKSYFLDIMGEENQIVERYKYYDNDYVKLFYGQQNQLLVFIFKLETISLFKMVRFFNPIMNQEFYYWEPIIYQDLCPFLLTDLTFVVTNQHFYIAFGEHYVLPNSENKQNQQVSSYSQKIIWAKYRQHITNSINCRNRVSLKAKNPKMISYQQNMDIQPYFPNILKFQELTKTILEKGNSKAEIQLLSKTLGWGFFDQISKNAIFMGGYSPQCGGQNCVNKYVHIVNEKDTTIRQTGKTTNEIFMGYRHFKSKIPLFPFIYGIPFVLGKSCFILSTNGYFENLTNNNKLFLTEFKLSHQIMDNKYGIVNQRKLFVEYEKDEQRLLVITAKDFLIHFIVNNYRYMNCHLNKCRLQTIDEGMLEVEMKLDASICGKPTVAIFLRTDRKQQHGFEEITLYFNPIENLQTNIKK